MKAAVIRKSGAPEVLHIEELPIPKPQPGWVILLAGWFQRYSNLSDKHKRDAVLRLEGTINTNLIQPDEQEKKQEFDHIVSAVKING